MSDTPVLGMSRKSAVRLIVALGMVSLFSDLCYEGGRSITGPFLAQLGVTAATVGFVSGFGELIGYALRLFSGYAADRSRAYWPLVIAGTIVNLGAVPLLALVHRWEWAAVLIVAERAGKALRTPARDVILSEAAGATGTGWGFGLHEALDQTGAFAGPLAVAAVLAATGRFESAFAMLAIPFGLAMGTLFTARHIFPHPVSAQSKATGLDGAGLPRKFWLYAAAASLIAAGFADFPLIAYHFEKTNRIAPAFIPLYYSVATGSSALTVAFWGRAYDRFGLPVLIASVLVCASVTPLVFLGSARAAVLGMAFWGMGLASHQSLLRAIVAGVTPSSRRGSAYGVFNTAYGLFWFAGSALMGFLYDRHVLAVVIFAVAAQLAAIPVLSAAARRNA